MCEDDYYQIDIGHSGGRRFLSRVARCENHFSTWWPRGRHLHGIRHKQRVFPHLQRKSSVQVEKSV